MLNIHIKCTHFLIALQTTALKILAGMDDATSGIGLVAGYDVDTERISVYER